MDEDELEDYDREVELVLYREYRDVVSQFRHVVETERRFYLANEVELFSERGVAHETVVQWSPGASMRQVLRVRSQLRAVPLPSALPAGEVGPLGRRTFDCRFA